MDEFGPLLIVILIWVFVGLPAAVAKKAKEQKTAARLSRSVRSTPDARTGSAPVSGSAGLESQPETFSEPAPRLRPTVYITPHDDSIYQGSLNAETGEGFDPCHNEDLERLNAAEAAPAVQPVSEVPALPFGWTGSDIVSGVVISEILKRKTPARR
ncbi:MAG: hypothetical protein IJL36_06600 [Clostridia bacterium]|nr:hypothetical protein [Clostridia bacterium]